MAKCPNCEVQIPWDSAQCGACSATFGGASTWGPIPESREERQKLKERYPAAYASPIAADPSNPYAPPQAVVEDLPDPGRRPFWVWAITIFYGFGAVSMPFSWYLVATNAATRAYWNSLTLFDLAMTLIITLVNLAGVVLLFRMRRRAPDILLAGLGVSLANTVYQGVVKNLFAGQGVFVGFLVSGAIVWYAYGLRRKALLR